MWWHDNVLSLIEKDLSGYLKRLAHLKPVQESGVAFIREGEKKKSVRNRKHLLASANDWKLRIDRDNCSTILRALVSLRCFALIS